MALVGESEIQGVLIVLSNARLAHWQIDLPVLQGDLFSSCTRPHHTCAQFNECRGTSGILYLTGTWAYGRNRGVPFAIRLATRVIFKLSLSVYHCTLYLHNDKQSRIFLPMRPGEGRRMIFWYFIDRYNSSMVKP